MPLTVYLEAAARTQALLTAKWTLRSCGCVVASTWHDEAVLSTAGLESHWALPRIEELKTCDAVVVVSDQKNAVSPELAFAIGWAAAYNLPVIWLGPPRDLPGCLKNIHFFASVDEFRRQLLLDDDLRSALSLNEAIHEVSIREAA